MACLMGALELLVSPALVLFVYRLFETFNFNLKLTYFRAVAYVTQVEGCERDDLTQNPRRRGMHLCIQS
ncbi:hypothetical protein QQP08_022742 [Theobroma cacao]|nr:hypothetical protein QQP08_022742 [Theobroma cacao]